MSGVKEKYKNIPLAMKTVFWFTICGFLQKAFGMLTTPIFTRVMNTKEYGEYSIFLSVTSILTVITTLNITSVLATKGINKYLEKKEQFLTNIQFLSSVSVLGFLIFYLCNKEWICQIVGLNEAIMLCVWGEIFVIPAYEIWSARQRYECNYKKIVLFTLIYLIVNTIIVITIVEFSQNKGRARIISSSAVLIIMYGLLYFSNIQWKKHVLNIEMIKFALKFNIPLIPQGLANQILSRSDILMVQYLQGTSQAGIYSLGYSIASLIAIFTTSVNNVYVPWLYKKLSNREIEDIHIKSIYMLEMVFTIVTGVILIAPEIVQVFAPKEYKEAIYVVAPVAVGIAFTMVYTLFVNIELYFEKTLIVMLGSVFIALLNVILNAYFIPKFGFVAAAYTTLVSYIGYSIMHFICVLIFCNNQISIFKIYNIKKITILCMLQVVVLGVVVTIYPCRALRYTIVVMGCLCSGLIIRKKGGLHVN